MTTCFSICFNSTNILLLFICMDSPSSFLLSQRKFCFYVFWFSLLPLEKDCLLSRFSYVQLFVTPWTVACQAPLSMAFSRQEYWSGLPCPPPGDLPNLKMNAGLLCFLHWLAGSLPVAPPGKPWKGYHSVAELLPAYQCT